MQTFNGIGTILYGRRYFNRADGSYIATKWFVFCFLPLIPLGSYKVWRGQTETKLFLFPRFTTPYQLQKVRMDWIQVIWTYLKWWGLFIGFIVFMIWLSDNQVGYGY